MSAVNIRHLVSDFKIIPNPFAGRLRTAGAPSGVAGYCDASLLEASLGLGSFEVTEIEYRVRRSPGLDRIEDGAGKVYRIEQVRRDRPGIAGFERLSGLIL